MFPQKFYPVALVGIQTQTHPEQMNMVRHEAISGAKQAFPGGGMEQHLAEMRVKLVGEPTGGPMGQAASSNE